MKKEEKDKREREGLIKKGGGMEKRRGENK